MMVKAHIVNHTHWDREWYFTSADALVLSEQLFTEVLNELVKNPNSSFVLDGQTSILDDYVSLHPEKMNLIKRLVKEERLYIGPWYTQTDGFFTHGESILRNAMIGILDSKKYGQYMKIGYLPDTFGFNAQMPVIFNQIGLDNFFFWRGIHLGKQVMSTYFKWKGLGGEKEVIAINMPQGYGTGMLLEPTHDYVDRRLDPAIEYIHNYSKTAEVLIPSGNDQLNIIFDFSTKIDKINEIGKHEYVISSYPMFLQYIKSLPSLEVYQGEFREPVNARVHKTIGSSRMNIKLRNYQLEQKILKRIEPLLVIAGFNNICIGKQLLIQMWKKILEGQAHDSLAGCVSDAVADDIMHRMKEAEEIADSIENTIKKKIADDLELNDKQILIFNTELHRFKGYKDVIIASKNKYIYFPNVEDACIVNEVYVPSRKNILEETSAGNRYIEEEGYYLLTVRLKVELPSLGYTVISFEEVNSIMKQRQLIEDNQSNFIGNDYYHISFDNQELILKHSNGKIVRNFIILEDEANAGDTYDFSPLQNDVAIPLVFEEANVEKSLNFEKMIIKGYYDLPLDLEHRYKRNKTGKLDIKLSIELNKFDELIHCNLEVNNQIYSHRLRLKINTGILSEENIASLPFGYIKRKPDYPKEWENIYSEKPIDIEPFDQSVSLTDKQYNCSVFTKGMKEYQHRKECIYITLFSTTGQLGKPDLNYRPGRASGDTTKKGHVFIPTPGAQLIGEHEFSFAIHMGKGAFNGANTSLIARCFQSGNIFYQRQQYNFFFNRLDNKIQQTDKKLQLNNKFELMQLPKEYIVSACHPSFYSEDKFIIRIENPTDKPSMIDKRHFEGKHVELVNAIEEPLVDQNEWMIPPYDVLTVRIKK